MIEIGKLPNARAAQALVDYLKGEQILCEIHPSEQGVTLVLLQEEHFSRVQKEYHDFIENPYQSKYLEASWNNGDSRTQIDYGSPGLHLFSQFMTGAGPLTLTIMLACIAIFSAMNLGLSNPIFESLSFFGATSHPSYIEFWRLFTPSLLHFSALHIIFNLIWWWYLGGKIETRIGFTPLFILLIVAGTLPNILQYIIAGPYFGGLSGVVYALLGYTWLMGIKRPQAGIGIPPSYMIFMLIWLALGFTDIFGFSVANGAHIGGLIIGLLQAGIDSRRKTL
ncbi:rhomboid family intramembrane serine protease GlpG [uncultured Shewanella sp.]|uniref:rhomboid family intramembrane serine protease GlpG n=1 Tax=uncultured Shewanella sp. TaxID=173975 RepID=UPI0026313204|nr:rhomboid family intramembrane serine protease GlpG [uncultured Shewanella sp.]